MSPIYTPGKLTLAKAFTQQSYMWDSPAAHGLWSPANITTALWLDAADSNTITQSGGAVSQWNDKSGNAKHASQTTVGYRPTYNPSGFNSRGEVYFTRDNLNHLVTPVIIGNGIGSNQSLTVVQLVKPGAGWGANNSTFMSSIGSRTVGGSWWSFIRNSNNNEFGFHGAAQYWSGFNIGTNAAIVIDTITSGTIYNSWANGTQIGTINTPIAAFNFTTSEDLIVGAGSQLISAEAYLGAILEVMLIPSSASTDIRQKVEGYLAHKWGLTANLPSDHPYKTVGPTP